MTVSSTPLPHPPVSSAGSAPDCSAAITRLMSQLDAAPDPAVVFTSLARAVVPALCDASTLVVTADGKQPATVSFQVTECAGDARSVVVPINPSVPEGETGYRGQLTMTCHGYRPTMTHSLVAHLLVELAISLVHRERLLRKTDNLSRALSSNRQIGAAMGILMATHQLTSKQAFEVLQRVSQSRHRKVTVIAAEVVETGTLELPLRLALAGPRPVPRPPSQPPDLQLAQ